MTINENFSVPTAAEIACRACVSTDAGLACAADLGGHCPSDPDPGCPRCRNLDGTITDSCYCREDYSASLPNRKEEG